MVNHFQIIDDMSDNYAEIIEDVSDEDNDDQGTLLPGHSSTRAGRYFVKGPYESIYLQKLLHISWKQA